MIGEKGYNGGNMQIPCSVQWCASTTLAAGAGDCKYAFSLVDQNGDRVYGRHNITAYLCTNLTTFTVAGNGVGITGKAHGILEPTATEIVSSLMITQNATVMVVNGAAVAAESGSSADGVNFDMPTVGIYGLPINYIPVVGGGATYNAVIFETDDQGRFAINLVAPADKTALVLELPTGRKLFFKIARKP